jgi:hypothetical protein
MNWVAKAEGLQVDHGNVYLVDKLNPIPYDLILGSEVLPNSACQNLQLCLAKVVKASQSCLPHCKIEQTTKRRNNIHEYLGEFRLQQEAAAR